VRSHPVLGLLVGLPILLLVLYTLGGLTEVGDIGLPVVPFATLLGLPVDLWIRDVATALALGSALILLVAPAPSAAVRRLALGSAAVWMASLVAQLALTVSEVFALAWSQVAQPSVLTPRVGELIANTDLGRVVLAQGALVAVGAVLLASGRGRAMRAVPVALLAVAAWLPGLTGHAGMEHGHVAATISLGLHMVAASAWVGGLVAAVVFIGSRTCEAAMAGLLIRRFSLIALVSVLVIAETGLLNASLRLDGLAALITSPYGAIILAKVGVLIVLIGWGLRHRRAIADGWVSGNREGRQALPVFTRWVSWEVMWMGAVYGLSIALSRTAPPGAVLPGDRLSVGAVIALLLGIPMAVLFAAPALARQLTAALRYPESVAVAAVVAVVVAATWQASALAAGTIGLQMAAVLTVVLLLGCGIVLGPAAASSIPAAVIVMIGLPIATWWIERAAVGGLGVGTWSAVLLAEGLLAWAAFGPGRALLQGAAEHPVPSASPAPGRRDHQGVSG